MQIQEIKEELKKYNKTDNTTNRTKLILYNEMKRKICVYTGKPITKEMAISKNMNRDHIIPYSISKNSKRENLMLCEKKINTKKGDLTPYQFCKKFGYDWNKVKQRASKVFNEKKKKIFIDEKSSKPKPKMTILIKNQTTQNKNKIKRQQPNKKAALYT